MIFDQSGMACKSFELSRGDLSHSNCFEVKKTVRDLQIEYGTTDTISVLKLTIKNRFWWTSRQFT